MPNSEDFFDRRFSSRISVHLSVTIEVRDPGFPPVLKLPSKSVNISTGGVSFQASRLIPTPVKATVELFPHHKGQPIKASGQILWHQTRAMNGAASENEYLYGLKFLNLDEAEKNKLGHILSPRFLSKEDLSERRTASTISSDLVEFKNRKGKKIVGFLDHLKDQNSSDVPFILIPPAYGETKREALSHSYHLAVNGFNVIRYDNTDHVGESDGDIFDTTLAKIKEDIFSTLDYAEEIGAKEIGVVASSLAARAAIKAAAEDRRIKLLICIAPVVNLQDTLKSVYNKDMVGSCAMGMNWGATNVLGFEVSGNFLVSAISNNFHNLSSTLNDLNKVHIPTIFLAGKEDPWVKVEDVEASFRSVSTEKKKISVFAGATHRLDGNLFLIRGIREVIIPSCLRHFKKPPSSVINEPNIREIAVQHRIEKERIKYLRRTSLVEERRFWEEYLGKFKYIVNIPDYWRLLWSISHLFGKGNRKETMLDAGCGNGSFGAFLLANCYYRISEAAFTSNTPIISYVGLDFVKTALDEAKTVHNNLHLEFIEKLGNYRILSCSYVLGDLNSPLNFKSDSFDKICLNMVISYLEDPLSTLRELVRVLKPKGKLILTSLMPQADLTKIYRNFMDVAETEDEIDEARKLLNNSGAIKSKEAEGIYKFYSAYELGALLNMSGIKPLHSDIVLDGQASLIVAEKS